MGELVVPLARCNLKVACNEETRDHLNAKDPAKTWLLTSDRDSADPQLVGPGPQSGSLAAYGHPHCICLLPLGAFEAQLQSYPYYLTYPSGTWPPTVTLATYLGGSKHMAAPRRDPDPLSTVTGCRDILIPTRLPAAM